MVDDLDGNGTDLGDRIRWVFTLTNAGTTTLTDLPNRGLLVETVTSWGDRAVAQQLEIRLAEAGIDHVGFSVHVPQYMAEAVLPQIAVTAFEHFSAATALTLPTDALRDDSRDALQRIEEQVAESPEIQAVISQLEQRYDEAVEGAQPRSLLAGDADELPDADEIGAAAEAFLAQRSESDDL